MDINGICISEKRIISFVCKEDDILHPESSELVRCIVNDSLHRKNAFYKGICWSENSIYYGKKFYFDLDSKKFVSLNISEIKYEENKIKIYRFYVDMTNLDKTIHSCIEYINAFQNKIDDSTIFIGKSDIGDTYLFDPKNKQLIHLDIINESIAD